MSLSCVRTGWRITKISRLCWGRSARVCYQPERSPPPPHQDSERVRCGACSHATGRCQSEYAGSANWQEKKASAGAASSRAGETQQSALLQSTAAAHETETTPDAPNAETAPAAVPKIEKPEVGDDGQVHANQHVGADEALAILAEFAKFVIARIAYRAKNIIVTITEEDADQFRSLCGRVELAIGAEPGAAGARSRQ